MACSKKQVFVELSGQGSWMKPAAALWSSRSTGLHFTKLSGSNTMHTWYRCFAFVPLLISTDWNMKHAHHFYEASWRQLHAATRTVRLNTEDLMFFLFCFLTKAVQVALFWSPSGSSLVREISWIIIWRSQLIFVDFSRIHIKGESQHKRAKGACLEQACR